jgi:ParB-like chromosome segregation protein Spo0J
MKTTKTTPEYKVQHVPINSVKSNADNPRIIKDDKFKKLVKSISEFPQMLELRPIIVDNDMIILGGNMRHKAAMECGLQMIPIVIAEDLTEEQKREFIIKDNVGFGEWDWDILANDWDADLLVEWGLDVWVDEEEKTLDDQSEESSTKVMVEFNSYELAEKFYEECLSKKLKVNYK